MVYEKRLNTLPELTEEIRTLDFDGGIRVQGKYGGEPCFIFITKSGARYVMALYSGKRGNSGSHVPDRRLMLKEYEEIEPLMRFLEGEALDPLEAYSY
jgi:hypothetical protein